MDMIRNTASTIEKIRLFVRWCKRVLLIPASGIPVSKLRRDRFVVVPIGPKLIDKPPAGRSLGVICHLFHEELADEVRQLLGNIDFKADLYISTDNAYKSRYIKDVFREYSTGLVEVTIVPNRGRDIAPKFISFKHAYKKHSLLLFIHEKKSLTSPFGDQWRESITGSIAGSRQVVSSIIELFDRFPRLGIVFTPHFKQVSSRIDWHGNLSIAKKLAKRMNFSLSFLDRLDFPSGSMFWARPAALKPLLDLNLNFEDFPEEAGQTRRTTQHAIERLILFVCKKAGYSWIRVADSASFSNSAQPIEVLDQEGLNALATVKF